VALSRRLLDVPASVSPNTDITPTDEDARLLEEQYNVRHLTVSKHSNIQQTVCRILDILHPDSGTIASRTDTIAKKKPSAVSISAEDDAPTDLLHPSPVRLVALSARAPAANKMISVVEIAKRELADSKTKMVSGWYQYTSARSRVEQVNEQNDTISKGSRVARKAVNSTAKYGAGRRLDGSKEDVVQDQDVDKELEDMEKMGIGVKKQSNGKKRTTRCSSVVGKTMADRN